MENVYELVANSIDARRPGEKIKIGVECKYNPKSQEFILYFKDNGTGFNKLERGLFIPYKNGKFSSTKNTFLAGNYLGGAGAALNGINNSLKDHKGKLSLANRRSGGAVLRLQWLFKNHTDMETSSSDSESS